MISALLSRLFGFGMVMTENDMEKVNEMRQGKHYMDEYAANAINRGSVYNPKIRNSPFVATFKYGACAKGYWTCDRMILQLEEYIDCLKVLHPQYHFFFIFDH